MARTKQTTRYRPGSRQHSPIHEDLIASPDESDDEPGDKPGDKPADTGTSQAVRPSDLDRKDMT